MRILQLNSAKNFGGGEKHSADLSKGLCRKGHEVLICLRETATWRDKSEDFSEDKIFRLPLRNAFDLFSAKRLAALLEENKIEILHAHLARDYPLAAFAVRLYPQTKLVLTRHVLFKMSKFHRLYSTNVSRIIAVSGAVKKQLETDKIFAPEKIKLIYNGIETKRWAEANHAEMRRDFRTRNGFSETDFLISTVGELRELKGQREFVEAAAIIAQKVENARFIVVGKDNSKDKKFAKELKKTVTENGLNDKFRWFDFLPETAPLLHASDVFVSASHSESFGLAILEAMSSACAIVATKTEGAKELLNTGVEICGKLVEIKDVIGLARAVADFARDEKLRFEKGNLARKRAVENFDLQKMIDATEAVYKEMTNNF